VIDVNKQIRLAVKTGKVELGCKKTLNAASFGRGKLLIVASNCPEPYKSDILYNAESSNIPVHLYQGTSLDLGFTCEKPFTVAALMVREPGDSEILRLGKIKDVSD